MHTEPVLSNNHPCKESVVKGKAWETPHSTQTGAHVCGCAGGMGFGGGGLGSLGGMGLGGMGMGDMGMGMPNVNPNDMSSILQVSASIL